MSRARLNPEYVAALKRLIDECPYFRMMGMRLAGLEPGRAEFGLEIRTDHLQPFDLAHGGVLASILDAACFWSAWPDLAEGRSLTTVDLKVNYLAPLTAGQELSVTGELIRLGGTLGLAQARARDQQGRLVGYASSTVMVLEGNPPAWLAQLPPKFSL